jgi:hypothetical protein
MSAISRLTLSIKKTATGQIGEVEQGEAEWLIEVLESLFDFSFVQLERKGNAMQHSSSYAALSRSCGPETQAM